MITLPPSLPQCSLRSGWSLSPVDPNRRTELDDGDIAVERSLSRTRTIVGMLWELSPPQKEVALDFWQRDLHAGQAWFMAPVSVGTCVRILSCQFHVGGNQEPPFVVTSPQNGVFHMQFQLATRELPVLTPNQRMAFDLYIEQRSEIEGLTSKLQEVIDAVEALGTWP